MLPNYFIYVAVILRLIGGTAYLRATLAGRAQPNPLSWLLWAVTPMIAFVAELSAGVGLPALVTLVLGITPLMVFIAAMFKNPKSFQLDTFNLLCGAFAVLGIVLWRTTSSPEVAISLAITADTISCLPTLRKVWFLPRSEYIPAYIINVASMTLTLLTIKNWTFVTYAFPLYVLVINVFIVCFILAVGHIKPRKVRRKQHSRRTMRAKPLRPRRA